ncbi:MAG: hypothetical protein JNG82_06885 [Opitutaceae bacterium]|jgi:tetratricopeptide (TPR) repeat protein|nr:hypothetical protein [Opitutaceae bacterium]
MLLSQVRHLLGFAVLALGLPALVSAQSANYRAQAKYYTAKTAYEAGKYADAIASLNEAKRLLEGQSNEVIQYLHIMSAYRAGRYQEAQGEMARFFDLIERREKDKDFTKDVDRVSADEIKSVTQILDDIEGKVGSGAEARNAARIQMADAFEAFRKSPKVTQQPPSGTGFESGLKIFSTISGSPEQITVRSEIRQEVRSPYVESGNGPWRPGHREATATVFSLTDLTQVTTRSSSIYLSFARPVPVAFSATQWHFNNGAYRQFRNESRNFTVSGLEISVTSPTQAAAAVKRMIAARADYFR